MERKDFFEKIKEDYFIMRTCCLEDLKSMICGVAPVFGELETQIEEGKDGINITFIDKDKADAAMIPVDYKLSEKDLDMSCKILGLVLDKEGIVIVVEHPLRLFTKANKELTLFYSSLIGKKILLEKVN